MTFDIFTQAAASYLEKAVKEVEVIESRSLSANHQRDIAITASTYALMSIAFSLMAAGTAPKDPA